MSAGYGRVPKGLMADKTLRATDKLVVAALWGFADTNGYAYPSATALAEAAGVCRRTVFNALTRAEVAGWVTRERRRREDGSVRSNNYFVHQVRIEEALVSTECTPCTQEAEVVDLAARRARSATECTPCTPQDAECTPCTGPVHAGAPLEQPTSEQEPPAPPPSAPAKKAKKEPDPHAVEAKAILDAYWSHVRAKLKRDPSIKPVAAMNVLTQLVRAGVTTPKIKQGLANLTAEGITTFSVASLERAMNPKAHKERDVTPRFKERVLRNNPPMELHR